MAFKRELINRVVAEHPELEEEMESEAREIWVGVLGVGAAMLGAIVG